MLLSLEVHNMLEQFLSETGALCGLLLPSLLCLDLLQVVNNFMKKVIDEHIGQIISIEVHELPSHPSHHANLAFLLAE